MNRNPTSLLVVSGPPGAGKTTLCIRVAAQLGARIGGLVSPARMEGGRKTGILVRDLASGEERLLAQVEWPREGRHQPRPGAVPSDAISTTPDRTEADAVPPGAECAWM